MHSRLSHSWGSPWMKFFAAKKEGLWSWRQSVNHFPGCAALTFHVEFWFKAYTIYHCYHHNEIIHNDVSIIKQPRCQYTSGRSHFRPYGFEHFIFVKTGNELACRVALMIMVASWMGLRWILEQPSTSSMDILPRFQELWGMVNVSVRKIGIVGFHTNVD